MNNDMVFEIVYLVAITGGFMLLLALCDWLFNLMYRFIPAFRRRMDRLFDSLPEYYDE